MVEMEKIFSRIEPELLLHVIYEKSDLKEQAAFRNDLSDFDEFLQVSTLKLEKNMKFRAHKHLNKITDFETFLAQESWVVISGLVEVSYFDIDNRLLNSRNIGQGGISVTFRGGHAYNILEEETLVIEFKSGPYRGQFADKEFID